MKQITKSKTPSPEQIVLAQLNHGGWIVKNGVAIRRHFGVSADDWYYNKPREVRVVSAAQVGDQMVLHFNTTEFGTETIALPFRVKVSTALRIELEEEFVGLGFKSKDKAEGNKQVLEMRTSLVLEHKLRNLKPRQPLEEVRRMARAFEAVRAGH